MKFTLRKPCANCPFRSDIDGFLRPDRAAEIVHTITVGDGTFSCHKTNDIDDEGETIETQKTQHCAGALIFLEHDDNPNQMMRIAERLGIYDRHKLDMTAPVFKTAKDFIEAQK